MKATVIVAGICLALTMSLSAQPWSTGTVLIYYNSGNVGIGISNPQNQLHVNAGTANAVTVATCWSRATSREWPCSEPVDIAGMKMNRAGTLIAKASEPLDSGRGAILILLSLQ